MAAFCFTSSVPAAEVIPSPAVASPAVLALIIRLCGQGQQDGLRGVLEKRSSVLSLALLDPVAVDLEGTRVYEFADGLDGVWVALYHLLGDGLGTAVVAVDAHRGEHSDADDLMEKKTNLR